VKGEAGECAWIGYNQLAVRPVGSDAFDTGQTIGPGEGGDDIIEDAGSLGFRLPWHENWLICRWGSNRRTCI
jgi:hypothetical protein